MEKSCRSGEKFWFVCCFLLTFVLLVHNISADDKIKKVTDPTGNVNLTPFEQWLSGYECMLNTSTYCQDKYQLTQKGWVNVTADDTDYYCNSGCAEHTREVLQCIKYVKPDFKFIDKANITDINTTITTGCQQGFTGSVAFSNARRLSESKSLIFSSVAAALFITTYLNM